MIAFDSFEACSEVLFLHKIKDSKEEDSIDETISPKSKQTKGARSKKREAPKDEDIDYEDYGPQRTLRSSRSKVVNYNEIHTEREVEVPKTPKMTKKKELEAERGNVTHIPHTLFKLFQ